MLKEYLLAILLSFPVSKYDSGESIEARTGRLSIVAEAIVDAAHGDHGKVAFLTAQARFESAFRADVQLCECPEGQCDNGKAHSLWQLHRAPALPESEWIGYCGTEYEAVQAGAERTLWAYDSRDLARSFARLGGVMVQPTADWVQKRVAEARRLEGRLKP